MKSFEFYSYYDFFVSNAHCNNNNALIKFLWSFSVILLCCYKRYSICLISLFRLYELFPAFICTNNTGILVNSLFQVKIFNPSFTSSFTSSFFLWSSRVLSPSSVLSSSKNNPLKLKLLGLFFNIYLILLILIYDLLNLFAYIYSSVCYNLEAISNIILK